MKNYYLSIQNCFRFVSSKLFVLYLVFFTVITTNAAYKFKEATSDLSSFSKKSNFLNITGIDSSDCTGAIGGSASGSITSCGSITNPAIIGLGYSTGIGSTYQWEYSTANFVGFPVNGGSVSGQINPATLITGLISTTTSYRLRVTCSTGAVTSYSSIVTITVTPTPPLPTVGVNTIISEGFNTVSTLTSSGWSVVNTSTPVGTSTWFQGATAFNAQSTPVNSWVGCGFESIVGSGTISNWLIAPLTTLQNGDVIKFWTRTVDQVSFPDRLQVRLSKTGTGTNPISPTDLGSYTTLLADINPTLTTSGYPINFTQYTLTVSGLSGPTSCRVAFRYFVTNGGPSGVNSELIGIDTFSITRTVAALQCYQSYVLNNTTCSYDVSGTAPVAPTGATGITTITCGGSTTLTVAGGSPGPGATAKWYTGSCGGTFVGSGNSILVTPSSGTTTYYVRYEGGTCQATSCAPVTVTMVAPCSIVNLKLFIQGYYSSISAMAPVKNNHDGVSALNEVESITVELHNATTYETLYATTATLKTDGTAVCAFLTGPIGSYYIVVKNTNAIQTWSATPQTVGNVALTYDFSTGANKAYDNNMIDLGGGVFGFYSGDINQDDVIDGSDSPDLDLDIFNSEFGIRVTDLNGDGTVDGSDATYLENNAFNSVFAHYPQ